jgi:hypothetical protein
VLAIASGRRKDTYLNREFEENEYYYNRLKHDPDALLREELLRTATPLATAKSRLGFRSPLKQLLRNVVFRMAILLGVHPPAVYHWRRFRRRGGFIDQLRKNRGLPPLNEDSR